MTIMDMLIMVIFVIYMHVHLTMRAISEYYVIKALLGFSLTIEIGDLNE